MNSRSKITRATIWLCTKCKTYGAAVNSRSKITRATKRLCTKYKTFGAAANLQSKIARARDLTPKKAHPKNSSNDPTGSDDAVSAAL